MKTSASTPVEKTDRQMQFIVPSASALTFAEGGIEDVSDQAKLSIFLRELCCRALAIMFNPEN
ncbi:hypothetical protein [Sulfitobacter sp. W074]|uniref:hypothetical protein n=1 Tax=Sulfitobacter sp. W074 TaxID=2867026 RepID=UPI0021A60696|nr:hypothetical protein [Sulfitobacter sp. W074]UWR38633.1 hypothetical protein K3762_06315 [Sulfitobacter sp. W074]